MDGISNFTRIIYIFNMLMIRIKINAIQLKIAANQKMHINEKHNGLCLSAYIIDARLGIHSF